MDQIVDLEDREHFKRTFQSLKRVCDKIALNPREDNSKELNSVLECSNSKWVQHLHPYVLFPLEVHLLNRNVKNDKATCVLLECLRIILSHITINEFEKFLKVYTMIFLQVDNKENPGNIPNVSEELKLNVVRSSRQLFLCLSQNVLIDFYSRKFYPKLSLSIYFCTQLAKNETFITLRHEALECILVLMQVHDDIQISDVSFNDKVADVVMLMVPGIASTCVAIANGISTQNHKVLVSILRVWSRAIGLVMADTEQSLIHETVLKLENPAEILKSGGLPSRGSDTLKERIESQVRNLDWLKTTGRQMIPITKIMTKLQFHPHWKVRRELVTAVHHILKLAPMNMSPSVCQLVDALLILSQDEHKSVAEASEKAVLAFAEICCTSTGKTLLEIVEESFYNLLTRLPRVLHGTDESSQESDLTVLYGYLRFLGPKNLPRVLSSAQHLKRLISALVQASMLDASSVKLLEEISLRDVDDETPVVERGWRQFKICYSQKMCCKLKEINDELRESSDLVSLTHSLLDMFNNDPVHRKEYILLISDIFASGPPGSLVGHIGLAKSVLNTFMDPAVWYVPVTLGNNESESKIVTQHNVVQVCLLLEGVARLAFCLGPTLFSPLLLRCLYPILECAGSPLYMIASAGLKSVKMLAHVYGGGVSQLVSDNVDYLSHHVTLNLRHAHKNPRVLSVLSVIMKHSSMQVLPSLHEIINDVLVQSCDTFQTENINAFLHAFYTFVHCVQHWIGWEKFDVKEKKTKFTNKTLLQELTDHLRVVKEANDLVNNENVNMDMDMDFRVESPNEEPEKKESVPDYVNLTVAILNRTLHFLPSKDISKQILVLQILNSGVLVLSKWKEQLLPIVHKIWSPLVHRFNSQNNPLLIQRAFSLLTTLAHTSEDFIRARTLKEVMPSLCHILKKSSKESELKDKGHAYRLSQGYKLQLILLKGLGPLLVNMEVTEKNIYQALTASEPYLSSEQPQPLQVACVEMWTSLSVLNPNIVWLQLISLCPNENLMTPPIPCFRTFKLEEKKSRKIDLYKSNADEVRKVLQGICKEL